jgi:hypothetical protein
MSEGSKETLCDASATLSFKATGYRQHAKKKAGSRPHEQRTQDIEQRDQI